MSSSISFATTGAGSFSPRDRLQDVLSSQITSGKVKASDKEALSSALDSIDSSLRSAISGGARPARPSPQQLQSKVGGLIDGQVKSGALTEAQATELKQVFSEAFAKGPGGAGAQGGPGGPGGPFGAAGLFSTDDDDDGDSNGSSTATANSSESEVAKLLQDFLKKLTESSSTYGSDGHSSRSRSNPALLHDADV